MSLPVPEDRSGMIDPEKQIQYWANRLAFLLRKELRERFLADGLDISAEEMALLMQLWRTPGQTPSALADATIRDRTTVTRFLDGMVSKGLVVRETDPDDRRRVIVKPTAASVDLQSRIMPVVHGLIAESMQGVPAQDAETARRVLQKITGNVLAMRG